MSDFGPSEAAALVADVFAPWVQSMGLEMTEGGAAQSRFRLPRSEALQLQGGPGKGVLCGQAVAAIADTGCVLALSAANGRFRSCTTVDMSVRFVRPVPDGAADVVVDVESNGKTLAVCRVSIRAEGSSKLAALATATFMYLEP